jgi:hypothetical protein
MGSEVLDLLIHLIMNKYLVTAVRRPLDVDATIAN